MNDDYNFCGCVGSEDFMTHLMYLEDLNDSSLIQKAVSKNFIDGKEWVDGTTGIIIDYLNRYSPVEGVLIVNPFMDEARKLITFCIKFLVLNQQNTFSDRQRRNHLSDPMYRYITLWSFIYQYLKVPNESTTNYPHIIMQYLANTDAQEVFPCLPPGLFTQHGSGIRCSWLQLKLSDVEPLIKDIPDDDIIQVMFE